MTFEVWISRMVTYLHANNTRGKWRLCSRCWRLTVIILHLYLLYLTIILQGRRRGRGRRLRGWRGRQGDVGRGRGLVRGRWGLRHRPIGGKARLRGDDGCED